MQRIVRGLVMAAVVAGYLASATHVFAATRVECEIMKDGQKTTRMVASADECAKLGGKVVATKH